MTETIDDRLGDLDQAGENDNGVHWQIRHHPQDNDYYTLHVRYNPDRDARNTIVETPAAFSDAIVNEQTPTMFRKGWVCAVKSDSYDECYHNAITIPADAVEEMWHSAYECGLINISE